MASAAVSRLCDRFAVIGHGRRFRQAHDRVPRFDPGAAWAAAAGTTAL